jgi:hypothetical protein
MIDHIFVKLNNRTLVPINRIINVDLSELVSETVIVTLDDGSIEHVIGFFALELIWLLKPSLLEGNTDVKWSKHMWWFHNIFAHPIMQVLAWLRLYKQAIWLHDITVPKPIGLKKN